MDKKHAELWAAISGYCFDEVWVADPFSARLARENRWSPGFAARVVEEYRRFVLLAATAGDPVCPSDAVDQVWHLHMQDSAQYWGVFCPQVLSFSLQHRPSRGGSTEDEQHRAAYEETLSRYRTAFGEEPPSDMWPGQAVRFGQAAGFARVSLQRNWVLSKPLALLTALGLIAAGALFIPNLMVVLNLSGHVFLVLYATLWCLVIFGTKSWQEGRKETGVATGSPLHAYELAYLAGGEERVGSAALAELVSNGSLGLSDASVLSPRAPVGDGAHPVDAALLAAVGSGVVSTVSHARQVVEQAARGIGTRLIGLGLISRGSPWPRYMGCTLLLLGGAKLWIGLLREHHVTYLALLWVAGAFVSCIHLKPSAELTNAATGLLSSLREQNPLAASGGSQLGQPIAVSVALFGAAGLEGLALGDLGLQLRAALSAKRGTGDGCESGAGDGGGGCGCGG